MASPVVHSPHELITKLVFATSPGDVKRICETAIEELESQQLKEYQVNHFLEKTIMHLEQFSPFDKNAQQWSNIITAKVICRRLRKQYSYSNEKTAGSVQAKADRYTEDL